jgi:hypothetical protein
VDGCGNRGYIRTVIPPPEAVLPLLIPALPDLGEALRAGIDYADSLQPDVQGRDPWYWSHSARWKARETLARSEKSGWALVRDIPNCGIHIRLGHLHLVRVLRSLEGNTPHPGSGVRRQDAWVGVQGQFPLGDGVSLPALSLIMDWQDAGGEPNLHLGLPVRPWQFLSVPRLHWRVPVFPGGTALDGVIFDPGPDTGSDRLVTLAVDPAEMEQA